MRSAVSTVLATALALSATGAAARTVRVCMTSSPGFSQPSATQTTFANVDTPTVLSGPEVDDLAGFDIDTWKAVASRLGYTSEYVLVPSFPSIIAATQDGVCDAGLGGVTLTWTRESCLCLATRDVEGKAYKDYANAESCCIDYAQAYFDSGYALMYDKSRLVQPSLLSTAFSAFFAIRTVNALAYIMCVIVGAGLMLWAVERGFAEGQFRKPLVQGLGDGVWWAAVTLTTVGYGDIAPRSPLGRMVALTYMMSSLLLVGVFSGIMTTEFVNVGRAQAPRKLEDVKDSTIVSLPGFSETMLVGYKAMYVPTLEDGIAVLDAGSADYLLFDTPLLLSYLRLHPDEASRYALSSNFAPTSYAFVFTENSTLPSSVNEALLSLRQRFDASWNRRMRQYFGVTSVDATGSGDVELSSEEELALFPVAFTCSLLSIPIFMHAYLMFTRWRSRGGRKADVLGGGGGGGGDGAPTSAGMPPFLDTQRGAATGSESPADAAGGLVRSPTLRAVSSFLLGDKEAKKIDQQPLSPVAPVNDAAASLRRTQALHAVRRLRSLLGVGGGAAAAGSTLDSGTVAATDSSYESHHSSEVLAEGEPGVGGAAPLSNSPKSRPAHRQPFPASLGDGAAAGKDGDGPRRDGGGGGPNSARGRSSAAEAAAGAAEPPAGAAIVPRGVATRDAGGRGGSSPAARPGGRPSPKARHARDGARSGYPHAADEAPSGAPDRRRKAKKKREDNRVLSYRVIRRGGL